MPWNWLPTMPWGGLRSHTAGGRRSRRHSFLEKKDTLGPEAHERIYPSESPPQQTDTTDQRPTSQLSSHSILGNADQTAQAALSDVDQTTDNVAQRMKNGNVATVPRSHRFSLLRLRHASDPQLSRSYNTSAPSLTPPLPGPTSKFLISCQPTTIGD